MGVPSLFRWLSQRYPKILDRVKEEFPQEADGQIVPVDTTKANPNGEEFDNLYLDMNGIVHPCSHPEDKPPPETEEDMMLAVFEYTDRVLNMVRPRKLLVIAVDGVAPRAKMNQQRQRRFRSAREAQEKDADREAFQKLVRSQKGDHATSVDEVIKKTWDSNTITPGTPFMSLLASSLRYWVAYKLNTDPMWSNLAVLISDASVPGEGEHKIMNFIRSQRRSPGYNPNTSHVIYGLDADLIMLALATHEPHFRVLREDVFFNKEIICKSCKNPGHSERQCSGPASTDSEMLLKQISAGLKPFMWLKVNVLREYLAVEMDVPGRKFPYNLERALDDWVFMCFFVGNDFLPHLPSLEIREGGIDVLIKIWRRLLPRWKDYVTKDGYPKLGHVYQIVRELSYQEDQIFLDRKKGEDRYQASQARKQAQNNYRQNNSRKRGRDEAEPFLDAPAPKIGRVKETTETYADVPFFDPKEAQTKEVRAIHHELFANRNQANKSAAAALKAGLKGKGDVETADQAGDQGTPSTVANLKSAAVEESDSGTPGRNTPIEKTSSTGQNGQATEDTDTVRLWESGYRDRYYEQKFHKAPTDLAFRHHVALEYARGLCWVLLYYMQGCPDWTWYYPYHYAPFAADFDESIVSLNPGFQEGAPFKPYEQLMGVLPAASNHAIPEPFRSLMTDEDSKILDFYPEDFEIDMNGAKQAWKGVALLPFIDEKRLLKAMAEKYPELSEDEVKRNTLGHDLLMFSTSHPVNQFVETAFYGKKPLPFAELPHDSSNGLFGTVEPVPGWVGRSVLEYPFEKLHNRMPDIPEEQSMRVYYKMPKFKDRHQSVLLPGVIPPAHVLNEQDLREAKKKANRSGPHEQRNNYNGNGGNPSYQQYNRGPPPDSYQGAPNPYGHPQSGYPGEPRQFPHQAQQTPYGGYPTQSYGPGGQAYSQANQYSGQQNYSTHQGGHYPGQASQFNGPPGYPTGQQGQYSGRSDYARGQQGSYGGQRGGYGGQQGSYGGQPGYDSYRGPPSRGRDTNYRGSGPPRQYDSTNAHNSPATAERAFKPEFNEIGRCLLPDRPDMKKHAVPQKEKVGTQAQATCRRKDEVEFEPSVQLDY